MIHRLIHDAAAAAPDAACLIGPPRGYNYAEAAGEVSRLAGALRKRGLRRIGFHAYDSAALVLLLAGGAQAGIDACVLNRDDPPGEVNASVGRFELTAIIADSVFDLSGAQLIPVQELFNSGPAEAVVPAGGENVAPIENAEARLLVLTSGTTGTPKGAWYTWSRLLAQARVKPQWAASRWLLAYHLNHFAGLHLLAHVVANRATLVIPSSPAVADAAAAMVQHGVQCASGTPTFWRLLLAELDQDRARSLPIRQVTLGGEAVPPDLPGRLADYFPRARISQIFATTEAGSCFSVRDGREGFAASLLQPGDNDALPRARIVEGELQVRSDHGMVGYYDSPSAAEDLPAEPGWRATGDLVEVRGDRVHFVGRKSEVINVGGVKVNPLPVEAVAQAVPGVRAVHCYGRRNAVTGQIVALDVVPAPDLDRPALESAIRDACRAALPRHAQPQWVRFVERLETVNQKVLRRSDGH